MQIIIPMSGYGERFRNAGYTVPKPLVELEGKPIIAHVIDMFPGEFNFTFVCNEEHLNEPSFQMKKKIEEYCSDAKVVGIKPHKLGPIHAVLQVASCIDVNAPCIVNYCDFSCYWNWFHFKQFVARTNCDGAIPAYKNFHPHSLGDTNYAYIREVDGWVDEIQEKKPFTDDRMNEFASSGTYYFKSGELMIEAFQSVIAKKMSVAGEYYVSVAYNHLIDKNKTISVYPLQHFMQWGTPEDVNEYVKWSDIFRNLLKSPHRTERQIGSVVMPIGGLGQRFVNDGYTQSKPLIPVSGKPMVIQAANDLPSSKCQVFVLRSDMKDITHVLRGIKQNFPNAIIEMIDGLTDGQACTAMIGVNALYKKYPNFDSPITIGACDNGMIYNLDSFEKLLEDSSVDIIVWGFRGHSHAMRNPDMYGWLKCDENKIKSVSVKEFHNPSPSDPIIIGTFTFKSGQQFRSCFDRLVAQNTRVNGEFYIDSLINDAVHLGFNCHFFEVDNYLSWGTPDDLKTFEYWQSCFHKWQSHPYSLDFDKRICAEQLDILRAKYESFTV